MACATQTPMMHIVTSSTPDLSLPTWQRKPLLLSLAVVVLAAVVLHLAGRIWWCESGDLALWISSHSSSHTSQHLFDPYTFSHLLHGLIFYGLLHLVAPRLHVSWRLFVAVLIETGWELLENSPVIIERYRKATASLGYTGDSIANSVMDILACVVGFVVARYIGWKGSVVIVVLTELIMLALIRDNLTLNIVMLIYPIQAIKSWQIGA